MADKPSVPAPALVAWQTLTITAIIQSSQKLEQRYKILYPISSLLCNALRDPRNVPDLLLLQLHVRVENAVLELLQKCHLVQIYLFHEKLVLNLSRCPFIVSSRCASIHAHAFKERPVFCHAVARDPHLVNVFCPHKRVISAGEQASNSRKKSGPLFLRQSCANRVDSNIDRPSVGLEGKNASHHVSRRSAERLAKLAEVLQVSFVERIPDDLDV